MAEFVKLYPENPNERIMQEVVHCLREGGLVIYPTDTVYGLGCDITNVKAMERLAKLKQVKLEKANFSFICEDLSNLSDYVKQVDTATFKLLKRALPGPYTFILPGSKKLPHPFKKRKTVGIRVPDNPIILGLVSRLGNPIVSTSIRDDDDILEYTTDPELIREKWDKKVDMVIDAGYGGNEASTVIDLSTEEPTIIREGKGSFDIF
jgi:tRNA threonylcarbamoyl adenosine modification protein (Sua5/YciO/YrdC/YwlC family)